MTSRFVMPLADVGSGIKPPDSAQLFFFESDGVTPKDTHTTKAATVANTNPVIAGPTGLFNDDIYITGDYLVTLKDKNDGQIFGLLPVNEFVAATDGLFDKHFATVAGLKVDKGLVEGDTVVINERSDARGTVVTGETPNELDIIDLDPVGLQWKLNVNGIVDYAWVGADTLLSDNKTEIQRAAQLAFDNDALLYGDPKSYTFTSQLNFFGLKNIRIEGKLNQNFTGVGIIIGHDSNTTEPSNYFINEAVRNGATDFIPPTNPVIRTQGLKNTIFELGKCSYLQLFADGDDTTFQNLGGVVKSISSNAYGYYSLGFITKLGLEAQDTTILSWINENFFNKGRITELVVSGDQNHNHNIFEQPTFEGETAFPFSINFEKGKSNWMYNVRFETSGANSGTVTFGADTVDNHIRRSNNTSLNPASSFRALTPNIVVTENGSGNTILSEDFILYEQIEMINISARNDFLGETVNFDSVIKNINSVQPGLDNIKVGGFIDLYESDFIPVENGDQFQWDFKIPSGGDFRSRMSLFDASKVQITAASDPGHAKFTTAVWDPIDDLYESTSIGNDTDECTIVDSVPKFVKILVRTGGAGPHLASNIAVYYYSKRDSQGQTRSFARQQAKNIGLSSAPDAGFVEAGFVVGNISAGGGTFTNVFSYEDTLNGALIATATSVTVNNISTVANGDVVGILLDDGDTHWSAVSALVGSTFTVAALPSAAADGNRIVFNRWV